MIIYTPLSEVDIFPAENEAHSKRHCVTFQGKQMYVEEQENGSYQLLQLLSTDPNDFMDQNYVPGTSIPNK